MKTARQIKRMNRNKTRTSPKIGRKVCIQSSSGISRINRETADNIVRNSNGKVSYCSKTSWRNSV